MEDQLSRHSIKSEEDQPLLVKTRTKSPSLIRSWKEVVGELRTARRLWSLTLITSISGLSVLVAGYTVGYASPALADLASIEPEYAFTNTSMWPDMFGVSKWYHQEPIKQRSG